MSAGFRGVCMGEELRESESNPVALAYRSGGAVRSRWPWIIWTTNAALLVVLGAIILAVFSRPTHSHSPRVICGTKEHQILTQLTVYAGQNQGNFPPTLRAAFPQSLTAEQSQLLQCPGGAGAYVYTGAGLNLTSISPDTILIYEPPSNHKSTQTGKPAMNIGQANGAVYLIESPKAEKIIAELKAGHNPPRAERVK